MKDEQFDISEAAGKIKGLFESTGNKFLILKAAIYGVDSSIGDQVMEAYNNSVEK